jgi:hypothetical protein
LTTFVTLLAKAVEKTSDAAPPEKKDDKKSGDERKTQDVVIDANQCR